jgi:hypothetical protein
MARSAIKESLALFAALLAWTVTAQFPPKPEGITVLKSRFDESITISYKKVS